MYHKQIKDINTITWHNLHFILEYYTGEVLSLLDQIIQEGEGDRPKTLTRATAKETKAEVIATVKTLKAMHTVINHHRTIRSEGADDENRPSPQT